ncbi:fatty acid alpha-hydroxylase [Lobosporangium transversale]|nr:fatty acid alpha-hydroxylase [Lobosporangium transversale]
MSFSVQQVLAHNNADSCWVIHNNKVYDMTSFVQDHPGGEEYILDHAGTDISQLMNDPLTHAHSDGAYEMLDEFFIGTLENTQTTTTTTTATTAATTTAAEEPLGLRKRANNAADQQQETKEEAEDYLKTTDLAADKKSKFLDLSQPLLWQLWNSDFSKAFYLEQVHIPRHISGSARIFGSPYLEVFTKTPWYIIPIFWLPIITYNAHRSLETGLSPDNLAALFVLGMFLWTLAEYVIHRFLFHLDDLLPDSTVWLTAHFLLHGIHHYLPMDR